MFPQKERSLWTDVLICYGLSNPRSTFCAALKEDYSIVLKGFMKSLAKKKKKNTTEVINPCI